MLAFNRTFIEFGPHVRGLERADDILRLLWGDWTNTCEGGAGWWEFSADVLTRTRLSTANLKSDEPGAAHWTDLFFRHDYGIDIILRAQDAEPVYGGWIMASAVKLSGRIIHGHRALVAEGDGLEVTYTFDPAPKIGVYRPENRAFDLSNQRKIYTATRPKLTTTQRSRRKLGS